MVTNCFFFVHTGKTDVGSGDGMYFRELVGKRYF